MSIKILESLETWRKAQAFALRIYRELIPSLPAEGHGRYYYQENVRFCYIARGSLEETLSHISFCYQVKYTPEPLYRELEQDGEKLSQMINGYIAYLKRSKQGAGEPGADYTIHELTGSYFVDPLETPLPNND